MFQFLVLLTVASSIAALQGEGPPRTNVYGTGEQDYGYYQVRKGAHMFYWLFYTQTKDAVSPYDKPLVIWLSGGPGVPSTGYGNFAEIGPVQPNGLTPRSSSWVNYVNVLFIDNPVGTGYSYVEPGTPLATNNEEVGADMVQFLTEFYKNHENFSNSPLYIFGEGYGGKMAVEIAKQLDAAIKNYRLQADFKGIALGSPWISPIDSCVAWAPYLLYTGTVDQEEHDHLAKAVTMVQNAIDSRGYNNERTKNLINQLLELMGKKVRHVNFRNIMHPVNYSEKGNRNARKLHYPRAARNLEDSIDQLMKTDVAKALGIPDHVINGYDSSPVFAALFGDYMKPATCVVEDLLKRTNLTVAIYNGQLELWTPTFGTLRWVDRLNWPGSSGWETAVRYQIIIDHKVQGYVKNYKNLSFYWINRAGKEVPVDNPKAGIEILRRVTEFDRKTTTAQLLLHRGTTIVSTTLTII